MENEAVILSNSKIAKDIYRMVLETEIGAKAKPGQFINISLEPFYLRRPISISDSTDTTLTIVYKIMGKGTDYMTTLEPGTKLNVLGPLGMGFPIVAGKDEVLLLGGGVGTPPMLKTAKAWLEKGTKVHVVLGFNTKDEVFYADAFEQIGITPIICTMDGSVGVKGTVMDGIAKHNIMTSFVNACGPLPMLKAVQQAYDQGYISLEARMGCGFGVCMGCVMKDKSGMPVRVCKNGPVFPIGKVVL